MNQQETSVELTGELSPVEAELAGAFEEDALSLQDAQESTEDEALPPSAMHSAPHVTAQQ